MRLTKPLYCPARAAFIAACCALLAACGDDTDGSARNKAAAAPPAIPVSVVQARVQAVPISLEAVGRAEGSREVEVRARVTGILEKRLFNEGEPVKAGATLFLIDRKPYEIAVAQAQAAVSQERARLDLARRESERLQMLAQNRAISQREFEESQSSVKQIDAAIEGAQARLAEAQLNLSYTRVTAPIGGITGRAARSEGSLVTANTEASLLTTLTQVHPIWVGFSLAEPDFERIRRDARGAQVSLLNQDGSVAVDSGRLNFAGSTVDPKLGTVGLRAEFPNPRLQWLPGQFVKVRVRAGQQEAILVPQAAVVQTEQSRMVWVVEAEGRAVMRPIETAGWAGPDWVVTGGLKPGETIVIDNLIKLKPGVTVKPHAPGEGPSAQQPAAPTGAAKGPAQPAKAP